MKFQNPPQVIKALFSIIADKHLRDTVLEGLYSTDGIDAYISMLKQVIARDYFRRSLNEAAQAKIASVLTMLTSAQTLTHELARIKQALHSPHVTLPKIRQDIDRALAPIVAKAQAFSQGDSDCLVLPISWNPTKEELDSRNNGHACALFLCRDPENREKIHIALYDTSFMADYQFEHFDGKKTRVWPYVWKNIDVSGQNGQRLTEFLRSFFELQMYERLSEQQARRLGVLPVSGKKMALNFLFPQLQYLGGQLVNFDKDPVNQKFYRLFTRQLAGTCGVRGLLKAIHQALGMTFAQSQPKVPQQLISAIKLEVCLALDRQLEADNPFRGLLKEAAKDVLRRLSKHQHPKEIQSAMESGLGPLMVRDWPLVPKPLIKSANHAVAVHFPKKRAGGQGLYRHGNQAFAIDVEIQNEPLDKQLAQLWQTVQRQAHPMTTLEWIEQTLLKLPLPNEKTALAYPNLFKLAHMDSTQASRFMIQVIEVLTKYLNCKRAQYADGPLTVKQYLTVIKLFSLLHCAFEKWPALRLHADLNPANILLGQLDIDFDTIALAHANIDRDRTILALKEYWDKQKVGPQAYKEVYLAVVHHIAKDQPEVERIIRHLLDKQKDSFRLEDLDETKILKALFNLQYYGLKDRRDVDLTLLYQRASLVADIFYFANVINAMIQGKPLPELAGFRQTLQEKINSFVFLKLLNIKQDRTSGSVRIEKGKGEECYLGPLEDYQSDFPEGVIRDTILTAGALEHEKRDKFKANVNASKHESETCTIVSRIDKRQALLWQYRDNAFLAPTHIHRFINRFLSIDALVELNDKETQSYFRHFVLAPNILHDAMKEELEVVSERSAIIDLFESYFNLAVKAATNIDGCLSENALFHIENYTLFLVLSLQILNEYRAEDRAFRELLRIKRNELKARMFALISFLDEKQAVSDKFAAYLKQYQSLLAGAMIQGDVRYGQPIEKAEEVIQLIALSLNARRAFATSDWAGSKFLYEALDDQHPIVDKFIVAHREAMVEVINQFLLPLIHEVNGQLDIEVGAIKPQHIDFSKYPIVNFTYKNVSYALNAQNGCLLKEGLTLLRIPRALSQDKLATRLSKGANQGAGWCSHDESYVEVGGFYFTKQAEGWVISRDFRGQRVTYHAASELRGSRLPAFASHSGLGYWQAQSGSVEVIDIDSDALVGQVVPSNYQTHYYYLDQKRRYQLLQSQDYPPAIHPYIACLTRFEVEKFIAVTSEGIGQEKSIHIFLPRYQLHFCYRPQGLFLVDNQCGIDSSQEWQLSLRESRALGPFQNFIVLKNRFHQEIALVPNQAFMVEVVDRANSAEDEPVVAKKRVPGLALEYDILNDISHAGGIKDSESQRGAGSQALMLIPLALDKAQATSETQQLLLIYIALANEQYPLAKDYIRELGLFYSLNPKSPQALSLLQKIINDLPQGETAFNPNLVALKCQLLQAYLNHFNLSTSPKPLLAMATEYYYFYQRYLPNIDKVYQLSQAQRYQFQYAYQLNTLQKPYLGHAVVSSALSRSHEDFISELEKRLSDSAHGLADISASLLSKRFEQYDTSASLSYDSERISPTLFVDSYFNYELRHVIHLIQQNLPLPQAQDFNLRLPCTFRDEDFLPYFISMYQLVVQVEASLQQRDFVELLKRILSSRMKFEAANKKTKLSIHLPKLFYAAGFLLLAHQHRDKVRHLKLEAHQFEENLDVINKALKKAAAREEIRFQQTGIESHAHMARPALPLAESHLRVEEPAAILPRVHVPPADIDTVDVRPVKQAYAAIQQEKALAVERTLSQLRDLSDISKTSPMQRRLNQAIAKCHIQERELLDKFATSLSEPLKIASLKSEVALKQKSADEDKRALGNSILRLVNESGITLPELQREYVSGQRQTYHLDELIRIYVRGEEACLSHLPALTRRQLKASLFQYMQLSVYGDYQSRLEKAIAKVEKKATAEALSQLASLLMSTNVIKEVSQFHFQALQYFSHKHIYQHQLDCFSSLKEVLGQQISPENKGRVLQLLMGMGKTSMLIPMLVFDALANQEEELMVVCVPEPLLQSQHQDLRQTISQVTNQNVFKFQFDRNSFFGLKDEAILGKMKDLLQKLLAAIQNRDILFSTVNSFLSFKASYRQYRSRVAEMSFYDFNKQGNTTAQIFNTFETIMRLFDEYAISIVDEVDEQFHPKYDLNYPEGEFKSLKQEQLVGIVNLYGYLARMHYQYPESFLAYLLSDHALPLKYKALEEAINVTAFTQESPIYPLILRLRHHHSELSEKEIQNALYQFWMNKAPFPYFDLIEEEKDCSLIATYKAMFTSYIGKTAIESEGLFEDYGPSLNPEKSNWDRLLAIPWVFDAPSESRVHEDPYLQFCYTCHHIYQSGLPAEIVYEFIMNLRQKADEESKNVMQPFHHLNSVMLFVQLTQLTADKLIHFTMADAKKMTHNTRLISHILQKNILPRIRYQPYKQAHSAESFMRMFKKSLGFSGTLSDYGNSMPMGMDVETANLGTDGYTDCVLQQVLSPEISSFKKSAKNSVAALLDKWYSVDNQHAKALRALIDCDSFFCGIDNLVVAQELARYIASHPERFSTHVDWVVFYDEQNNLKALNIHTMLVKDHLEIELDGNISEDNCFTFYDKSHTRGAHVGQTVTAHALVTFGRQINKNAFYQAVRRMRKLGRGQTLDIIVDDELAEEFGRDLTLEDVDSILDKNQDLDTDGRNFLSALAKIKEFLIDYLDKKILLCRDLRQKHALIQKLQQVFVDENDFAIEKHYRKMLGYVDTLDLLERYGQSLLAKYRQIFCFEFKEETKLKQTLQAVIKKTLPFTMKQRFSFVSEQAQAASPNLVSHSQQEVESLQEAVHEAEEEALKEEQRRVENPYLYAKPCPHTQLDWRACVASLAQEPMQVSETVVPLDVLLQREKRPTWHFSTNVLLTQNFAKTITDKRHDILFGPYTKNARLMLCVPVADEVRMVAITEEDYLDLVETYRCPNETGLPFWVEDLASGEVFFGHCTRHKETPQYQQLLEQFCYFNGDCKRLATLSDAGWLTALKPDKVHSFLQEKLDFLKDTILRNRPLSRDLDAIDRAFRVHFSYLYVVEHADTTVYTNRFYQSAPGYLDFNDITQNKIACLAHLLDSINLIDKLSKTYPYNNRNEVIERLPKYLKDMVSNEEIHPFVHKFLNARDAAFKMIVPLILLHAKGHYDLGALPGYNALLKPQQRILNHCLAYLSGRSEHLPSILSNRDTRILAAYQAYIAAGHDVRELDEAALFDKVYHPYLLERHPLKETFATRFKSRALSAKTKSFITASRQALMPLLQALERLSSVNLAQMADALTVSTYYELEKAHQQQIKKAQVLIRSLDKQSLELTQSDLFKESQHRMLIEQMEILKAEVIDYKRSANLEIARLRAQAQIREKHLKSQKIMMAFKVSIFNANHHVNTALSILDTPALERFIDSDEDLHVLEQQVMKARALVSEQVSAVDKAVIKAQVDSIGLHYQSLEIDNLRGIDKEKQEICLKITRAQDQLSLYGEMLYVSRQSTKMNELEGQIAMMAKRFNMLDSFEIMSLADVEDFRGEIAKTQEAIKQLIERYRELCQLISDKLKRADLSPEAMVHLQDSFKAFVTLEDKMAALPQQASQLLEDKLAHYGHQLFNRIRKSFMRQSEVECQENIQTLKELRIDLTASDKARIEAMAQAKSIVEDIIAVTEYTLSDIEGFQKDCHTLHLSAKTNLLLSDKAKAFQAELMSVRQQAQVEVARLEDAAKANIRHQKIEAEFDLAKVESRALAKELHATAQRWQAFYQHPQHLDPGADIVAPVAMDAAFKQGMREQIAQETALYEALEKRATKCYLTHESTIEKESQIALSAIEQGSYKEAVLQPVTDMKAQVIERLSADIETIQVDHARRYLAIQEPTLALRGLSNQQLFLLYRLRSAESEVMHQTVYRVLVRLLKPSDKPLSKCCDNRGHKLERLLEALDYMSLQFPLVNAEPFEQACLSALQHKQSDLYQALAMHSQGLLTWQLRLSKERFFSCNKSIFFSTKSKDLQALNRVLEEARAERHHEIDL